MIVYGALLLPVVAAIVLLLLFRHRMVWWELFVPMAASLLLVIIGKALVDHAAVRFDEYWGAFVKEAEHYEDWNEYIHQTCTRSVSCGENCTTTETYDCSYVDYHPEYWRVGTTIGENIHIREGQYKALVQRFGGEHFVDLHRHYHTDDGDKYVSLWPGDSASAEPTTTLHTYVNRVKAADQSLFNYGAVSDSDVVRYDLFGYPPITDDYKQRAVLGDNSPDGQLADRKLRYWNGLLGPKKELRIYLLVYQDQPEQAAILQEWKWVGANMNEFVVAIGIDKYHHPHWCRAISWTRNEMLKPQVRQLVMAQNTLDLAAIADQLGPLLSAGFERRDFAEFDYLTVEPPTWAVWLIYLLTAAACVGCSWWAVMNDIMYYDSRWGQWRASGEQHPLIL